MTFRGEVPVPARPVCSLSSRPTILIQARLIQARLLSLHAGKSTKMEKKHHSPPAPTVTVSADYTRSGRLQPNACLHILRERIWAIELLQVIIL